MRDSAQICFTRYIFVIPITLNSQTVYRFDRPIAAFIDNHLRRSIYFGPRKNYGEARLIDAFGSIFSTFAFLQTTHRAPIEVVILVLYFVVIVVGFYTEDSRYTSKEFLLSNGKKNTWTAGSSSASTNLCLSSWDGSGRPTNMTRVYNNAPMTSLKVNGKLVGVLANCPESGVVREHSCGSSHPQDGCGVRHETGGCAKTSASLAGWRAGATTGVD